MCHDAQVGDLMNSRIRWYDTPALLLRHRPVRCRMCHGRYFIYRGSRRRRESSELALSPPHSFFPRLWTSYCFLIVVSLGIFAVTNPGDHLHVRSTLTSVFQKNDLNGFPSTTDSMSNGDTLR